jgi:phage/plasmid-like protein (TIGR03299 family)
MAHGLETYIDEDGNKLASFASLRQPGWHALGTVFDKPVTTEKMLELSYLANWDIRFVNASDVMKGYTFENPEEYRFVVRDNPFIKGQKDVLGAVGDRYNIFSNESIFDFGDKLTNGQRRWETAGSINNGKRVFATLVEHNDIVLDPNGSGDVIKRYLMLTSSHNGSSTLIAKKVNTRVVCQNTLNVAMGERGDEFRIRHTQGMETKLEDAKAALGFAQAYDDAFEAEAQAMIQKQMTKDQFREIIADIYPKPGDNARGRMSKWEFKEDALMTIWENGTGSMKNLDDTAWKAVNALTEYGQWFREVRKGNTQNYFAAGAGFDNVANDSRNEIWQKVLLTV